MFIKVKQRKLQRDTAIDVLLLFSYRASGANQPKQRFIKQWTTRKSDLARPNRRQWFLDDVEYELTTLVPDCEKRQEILIALQKKCSEYEV
jgi:hypothetical protein